MIVPPPWHLTGHGFIVFLTSQKRGAGRASTDSESGNKRGRSFWGPGILMALDYSESEIGPYREVLYIPGYCSVHVPSLRWLHGGSGRVSPVVRGHSVSWIAVTTTGSRDGGIANWGLPKELGNIDWHADADRTSVMVSGAEGQQRLGIEVTHPQGTFRSALSRLSFPVNARLLPHTLLQMRKELIYVTSIAAVGRARIAGRVRLESYSPDTREIANRKVLTSLRIDRFGLTFPRATKRLLNPDG